MPLKKYNKFFGGKAGSAEKAHSAMTKQYGAKKGEEVFYATKNKRKSEGLSEHISTMKVRGRLKSKRKK